MATKTVGDFSLDTDTGEITGPAAYMRSEDFADWKSRLRAGADPVVNSGYSPDFFTAVLVSLQTNYAGWHGRETFLASIGR